MKKKSIQHSKKIKCPQCKGTGKIADNTCTRCKGSGQIDLLHD